MSVLSTVFLPRAWLSAFITPILKKGDPASPSNYRPISLTCVLCKVMETVIKNELLRYLAQRNLISRQQHAFLIRRSTVTNLLDSTLDWAVMLDVGTPVDVVYIDFAQAFDSVVHRKLLTKLSAYGICGKLLLWISAFLYSRLQCVVVENTRSQWCSVISGVPQGSVLGPVLFVIYINDIADCIGSETSINLFADDAKLYSSVENAIDSTVLQSVLDKIIAWADYWQLTINTSKSHVLHLGSGNALNDYCIKGKTLECSVSIRDLGVVTDRKLSYDIHIDNIIHQAYSRVGILFKSFVSRNSVILRQAYITYIRPVLEYACNVWSPYKVKHINGIEKIQRYFTRRISGLQDLNYAERLARLNLETLEIRRLRSDLVLYYKILNNLTVFSFDDVFTSSQTVRVTRSLGKNLLCKPACHTKVLENNFFVRQINCWNNLSDETKNAPTVAKFKRVLMQTDFSSFLLIK